MTRYMLGAALMPEGNVNGWQERHRDAVSLPYGCERPIVMLVNGWTEYANQHSKRYETGIGQDYVLGKEWQSVGLALLGLLNGELGRLDGGTLDGFIRDTLEAEGFDRE
jgi:hypothetical protein